MSDLVPCKTCEQAVAKSAPLCPHCGREHPAGKPVFKAILLALILIPGTLMVTAASAMVMGPFAIIVFILCLIFSRQVAKANGIK